MQVVHITAREQTIFECLSRGGRENQGEIEKRITRSREMVIDPQNCIVIQNDTTMEEAGHALRQVLLGSRKGKHSVPC